MCEWWLDLSFNQGIFSHYENPALVYGFKQIKINQK